MRGKFITFDGIDGAGKGTQITILATYLKSQGKQVYTTREPGGTPLSEDIRGLFLNPNKDIIPEAELLLVFAARAQHIKRVLAPKINAGVWVICDRFTDATLAYQGYGRGVELEKIEQIASVVHDDFNPDISFFLDLDVEEAACRRGKRGQTSDRFEQEHNAFMQRVREGYLDIAKNNNKRCYLIDASQKSEIIGHEIQSILNGAGK